MKKALLFLLLAAPLLAQSPTPTPPPAALDNWPVDRTALSLTDPATTNQVAGWDNTLKKWVWVTNGAGGGVTVPLVLTLDNNLAAVNDALSLVNTTSATTTNRIQTSPDLRWQGQGWKLNATAASQMVEWRAYALPATDNAAPENYWLLDSRTNGASGTWTNRLQVWDGEPGGSGTWLYVNNITITGTAGKGALELKTQSVDDVATVPANGVHLYSDSTGRLTWKRSDGFNRRFASTLTADRIYTLPDAAATMVVPDTGATNNFLTAISAGGAISKAQPAFSNLSGNIATSQMNSGTSASGSTFWRGDGTWAAPAGAGTVTNDNNLQTNFIVLGGAAGTTATKVTSGIISDGTSKFTLGVSGSSTGAIDFKNGNSGTITLSPVTGPLGSVTLSLPATTGTLALSGANVTAAQMPALTGEVTTTVGTVNTSISAGAVTLGDMANVATGTVFYRKTTGTGSPEVQTLATLKTDLALTNGTVTNTGGNFTTNALVLAANNAADTKVVGGITTDGTSKLTLGVAGTSVGSIDFKNATSGTVTLHPPTGALASADITLPIGTRTLATLDGTETLTNKTIASTQITGLPTFPSGTVVGTTDTQTLTNKRINPRVDDQNVPTSPYAVNSDNFDMSVLRGINAALTVNAPTGTPVQGQKLILRFKDDGTARALTFQTGSSGQFRFSTDLPVVGTTVINKTLYYGFIYNSTDSRWDCVAIINNF